MNQRSKCNSTTPRTRNELPCMDMFVVFVCVIVCVFVIAINDRVIHFVQLIINMHIYSSISLIYSGNTN